MSYKLKKLIVLFGFFVGANSQQCPNGWFYNYNKCWFIQNTRMTQTQAEQSCISQGGTLAAITNAFENDYINQLIAQQNTCDYYFLGGTWINGKGSWINGDPFIYTKWDKNDPYHQQPNPNKTCIGIYRETDAWRTMTCTDQHCSVCSIEKFVKNDELVLVQAVWRHGDRSPIRSWPTDPYQASYWPDGFGQLTIRGIEQHNNLGKKLRERYITNLSFVSPTYKTEEIYVLCTNFNRTIQSMLSNMVGFYNVGQLNKPGLVGIPNKIGNPMGFAPPSCARENVLLNLVEQTPQYKNLMNNQSYQNMMAKIKKLTDWDLTFQNVVTIEDTLYIEHFVYNLPLVNQDLLALWREINSTADLVLDWDNGWGLSPVQGINFSTEISKVKDGGGILLWAFIEQMQAKLYCKNNPSNASCNSLNSLKYFVYSAHDSTLEALFAALGFKRSDYNEDGIPQYSSAITFELWIDTNQSPYLKVMWWPLDQPAKDVTQSISGCYTSNGTCPLDTFITRSLSYMPDNGDTNAWCQNTTVLKQ
uniref:acid phosphatase n=1 Tax=Acrobeloides nanus TaxID=290746 RepID=A0A914C287_9BILA